MTENGMNFQKEWTRKMNENQMIIHFKDGSEITVSREVSQLIHKRISEGCNKFQMFTMNDEMFLLINIEEIVFMKECK